MTTIVLNNTGAERAIAIVKELRLTLRQHADFDYRFLQGGYDTDAHIYRESKAEFTFYNPADATAFSLKYL